MGVQYNYFDVTTTRQRLMDLYCCAQVQFNNSYSNSTMSNYKLLIHYTEWYHTKGFRSTMPQLPSNPAFSCHTGMPSRELRLFGGDSGIFLLHCAHLDDTTTDGPVIENVHNEQHSIFMNKCVQSCLCVCCVCGLN